jgi:hypothetical protein
MAARTFALERIQKKRHPEFRPTQAMGHREKTMKAINQ